MKLLVTGGCGFLGSNLVEHALEQGFDVCIFDNLHRKGATENLLWLTRIGRFKFEHGDIRCGYDVDRLVKRYQPDRILHVAGQVAMTTSIEDPRRDFEVNALGTLNLLEAVRQYAPNAGVIYSSTNKVYGDLEQYRYRETETRYECIDFPHGFDEKVPLDFHSPYGCSKGCADQYMLDYHRIHGLRTLVFRHSSMYGGRQFATADQGWVGWFCRVAVEMSRGLWNEEFTISGTGKQVRDVLHAKDMVALYFSAIQRCDETCGVAYNVGGGMPNSLSLLELFAILEDALGIEMRPQRMQPRISDQRVFVANLGKVTAAFDWAPTITSTIGVQSMLEWVESVSR